jgi:hypothetical protein
MTLSDVYSCLLTAKFDYALDAGTGKWTPQQEAYKLSTRRLARANVAEQFYPYKVVETKLKVNGVGKVVVLRYESSPGKDFQLIGRITPFTTSTEG